MLNESEGLEFVAMAHDETIDELPSPTLHCARHVAIESQLAMGEELPVAVHLDRLVAEGLTRLDAIHAIAPVLTEHMFDLVKHPRKPVIDPSEPHNAALARLWAREWRKG